MPKNRVNIGASNTGLLVMMYALMIMSLMNHSESVKNDCIQVMIGVLITEMKIIPAYMYVATAQSVENTIDQYIKISKPGCGSGTVTLFDCIFTLAMCNNTILYLVCDYVLVVLLLMPKSGQVINNYIYSISSNLRHTMKNTYIFFTWKKIISQIVINSILESGQVLKPLKKNLSPKILYTQSQIMMNYLKIFTIISIVTLGSIVNSLIGTGQLIETLKNGNDMITYLLVVIKLRVVMLHSASYSIIGSGQFIETVNQSSLKKSNDICFSVGHNYNWLYFVGQTTNIFRYFVQVQARIFEGLSLKFSEYLHEIFIIFRAWTCRQLQSKASEATYKARERRALPSDLLLVPHVEGVHGTGNKNSAGKYPIDKATVANRIAGFRHHKIWTNLELGTTKGCPDTKHMAAFLKHAPDPSALYDPGLINFDKLIPSGAPLLDYLKLYRDVQGTWDYPPRHEIDQWRRNRGISPQWFQGTNITEYTIGSSDNFKDFVSLFWENYKRDQELLPTGVLSLDVEDKQVWLYDMIRICKFRDQTIVLRNDKETREEFPKELYDNRDNAIVNVPAKIMFGGVHWGMMISLGITRSAGDVYSYDCKGFPDEIIDFLESLPPVVGAGIKADVKAMEEFVEAVNGRPMRFKAFMELGVLATLCGWQLNRRGMFILSLVTMGSTMNKKVSCADGQWGIPFHELDPALQCYAIGDTKMGHITYGVLITAFLNQVAPDPDMACRLSNCSQYEWVTWFCSLIRESLVGLEICQQAAESEGALRGSYQELVNIIRYRDIHGQVSSVPPDNVIFIAGLVKWPSISRGGPRYLHAVRLHHISVYNAIKESTGLPGTKQYFSRDVEVIDRMYATFGHRDILSLDLEKGIDQPDLCDFLFSLVVHPDIRKPILSLRFPLDVHYIHSCSIDLDRGVREAMLEWFRLDVSRIEEFVRNCNDNRELAIDFRGRHEDIRLMYLGLMNADPHPVMETEESIRTEVNLAIGKLRAFKAELLTALQRQDDILHELYLADSGVMYQDRYSWKRKPLPQVAATRSSVLMNSMGMVLGSVPVPVQGNSSKDGYPVGKPLEQRLREFDLVEPSLEVMPVLSMRMRDQCCDGGRYTGKSKRKSKSAGGLGAVPKVLTQDQIEEEVRVVRQIDPFEAPDPSDFIAYCDEAERFFNDLPPTPVIDFVLDD